MSNHTALSMLAAGAIAIVISKIKLKLIGACATETRASPFSAFSADRRLLPALPCKCQVAPRASLVFSRETNDTAERLHALRSHGSIYLSLDSFGCLVTKLL